MAGLNAWALWAQIARRRYRHDRLVRAPVPAAGGGYCGRRVLRHRARGGEDRQGVNRERPGPTGSLQNFSQPGPPDPAVSVGIPDLACVADEVGKRHGAELAGVGAQVAIITEQEYLARWDCDVEVAARAGLLPLHTPTMLSRLLGDHGIVAFDGFGTRKTAAVDNDVMRRDRDVVAGQADHALDIVLRAIVRIDKMPMSPMATRVLQPGQLYLLSANNQSPRRIPGCMAAVG